ncbi:MAG TPA: hypothetical protein DEQ87_15710 [Algoriphagus sp.]|nr:hypothetical protein [Algoriphagus sp.]MAN87973.1 hypothetical protein [Algoriphagus sp.]HAS60365.1 hypothetical protein [Algoriphagus sp.]HCD89065.1 hypothetical protein [Algoriphagus sp.]
MKGGVKGSCQTPRGVWIRESGKKKKKHFFQILFANGKTSTTFALLFGRNGKNKNKKTGKTRL